MKPTDDIKQIIKNAKIKTDPTTNDAVLADLLGRLESAGDEKQSRPPNILRILMKSKMMKATAAVVILLAALIGYSQFMGSIDGTSIVLANVAKKIEQVKNIVGKQTTTVITRDNNTNTFHSSLYVTEDAGRQDTYDNQEIIFQIYANIPEGTIIWIDHAIKAFKKADMTEEDIEKWDPTNPKNTIKRILSIGEYIKLGKKKIDGILSEGFEFDDKRMLLSMDKEQIANIVTRLWIDVDTNMPIRVEADCDLINNTKMNMVMYDLQWDVELETDFFEPQIPADYMNIDDRGLLGIIIGNWPKLRVAPGKAAEKAGVKNGDVVLKVDGNSIAHIDSPTDAQILLLGKVGEKTVLTVKRGQEVLTIEIPRGPIPQ